MWLSSIFTLGISKRTLGKIYAWGISTERPGVSYLPSLILDFCLYVSNKHGLQRNQRNKCISYTPGSQDPASLELKVNMSHSRVAARCKENLNVPPPGNDGQKKRQKQTLVLWLLATPWMQLLSRIFSSWFKLAVGENPRRNPKCLCLFCFGFFPSDPQGYFIFSPQGFRRGNC